MERLGAALTGQPRGAGIAERVRTKHKGMRMSDAKHTPGPWQTNLEISSQAGRVAIEPDIAVVYVQSNRYDATASKQRLANARLIAAAPDLYEVVRELVECADYWSEYDVPLGVIDRMKSAITKATAT
jgi:hypothetical protein